MDFVDLQDTPTNYSGDDTKSCVVDEANDQLIFDFPIPAFHAADHEVLGVDEMVVEGLLGELADIQKSTFLKLSDTPANYVGAANKYPRVNALADGLEFDPGPTGYWSNIATANPVGAASVQFLDPEPGVWYRVLAKIKQNTANAMHGLRFNNDGGANYYYGATYGASTDVFGGNGAAGLTYLPATARFASLINVALTYDYVFRTYQGNDQGVYVLGRSSFYSASGALYFATWGGVWSGAADLTSCEIILSAGDITGQVILSKLIE